MVNREVVRRARDDVEVFAEAIVGQPLWPHQAEVLRDPARHRVICSGRQAGKSTTLAIATLHEAFTKVDAFVLIVSATEDAAKDLLATIRGFAAAPLLAGSVVDDNKQQVVLSNGSTVRSIASSQRQARGHSADLLVLDEACFIDEAVWQAAKFTIVARPGSKIIMASTPWGPRDRFFSAAFQAGRNEADGYASFHWPSTISPLVDAVLLEQWRLTDPERVFRAEVLAEWVDDVGAYFTAAEIDHAVVDYDLIPPEKAYDWDAVAGVDWGFAHDASTLVLLAEIVADDPVTALEDAEGSSYWLPWLEEAFGTPYMRFIDRVEVVDRGYYLRRVTSEMNGVGAMPTQELAARLGANRVLGVHTDSRLKEDAFGRIKLLLQQSRLRLPRHPALLRQLSALEYEQLPTSGLTRIAVPERAGHDDLAMGLALAVHGDPKIGAKRDHRRKMRFRGTDSWGASSSGAVLGHVDGGGFVPGSQW